MNMGIPSLKAYLINLPSSVDRREKMELQLSSLVLNWELFQAIDGRSNWDILKSSVDHGSFTRNTGRTLLPGEIGCYHSHLAVWRSFIGSNFEVALVMEDDVVFHKEFTEAISAALSAHHEWDFLKLNKVRAKQPISQCTIDRWSINAYLGPATGLGAYLIKRNIAERLLPAMLPITRPIDHELDRIHVHKIRHFGLEPFPSHVDDGNQSTITGKNYSKVRKFPWYRRLPVYGLRTSNAIRRLVYLVKAGRLPSKRRTLQ